MPYIPGCPASLDIVRYIAGCPASLDIMPYIPGCPASLDIMRYIAGCPASLDITHYIPGCPASLDITHYIPGFLKKGFGQRRLLLRFNKRFYFNLKNGGQALWNQELALCNASRRHARHTAEMRRITANRISLASLYCACQSSVFIHTSFVIVVKKVLGSCRFRRIIAPWKWQSPLDTSKSL